MTISMLNSSLNDLSKIETRDPEYKINWHYKLCTVVSKVSLFVGNPVLKKVVTVTYIFFQYLKTLGYNTHAAGKWHLGILHFKHDFFLNINLGNWTTLGGGDFHLVKWGGDFCCLYLIFNNGLKENNFCLRGAIYQWKFCPFGSRSMKSILYSLIWD